VPPISTTPRCSDSSEITGSGVSGANSVELALSRPRQWRDNSIRQSACQADAEIRFLVLAGKANRFDLALDAARAESRPDQDAVEILQMLFGHDAMLKLLRVHPLDVYLALVGDAGVGEASLMLLYASSC